MANELSFLKVGNLYQADQITTVGNTTIQIGFGKVYPWVRIESTLDPDSGWSLYSFEQAPRLPVYYTKHISNLPSGTLLRITTNALPSTATYLVDGSSSGGGGSVDPSLYARLAEQERINKAQQTQIDNNKTVNDAQQATIKQVGDKINETEQTIASAWNDLDARVQQVEQK